jgi:hypothetical protein
MGRFLATAAVCGVLLFGFAPVAGADPSPPNPNPNGPAHTGTACQAILDHNGAIGKSPTPPGIYLFEGVGEVFCGI